jgi:hypothetical protein
MKKWFWCGVAAAVAAAGGVYAVAAYVQRHPDGLPARCTVVALRMGAVCNPVLRAGRGILEEACEAPGTTAAGPGQCGLVEPEYRGDAESCEDGYRPLPACPDEDATDFVTQFCRQHCDAGPVQGGEEACEPVLGGKPLTCRETEPTTRAHPVSCPEGPCCPYLGGIVPQVRVGTGEVRELLPPPRCVPAAPKPCGKEDQPTRPTQGVDTTEFRPSDAKKGEFDRIPF